MSIKALKGFKDVTAEESYKWHYIEQSMRSVAASFGYQEVRTPVLEMTELFARGVGGTTDIVQKEMYTFMTKGEDSVTLKPEGTAGVVRQFVENSGFAKSQPTRMYYLNCPVFRYEQPQAGRLREHHQFGVELFGSPEPVADAEVIMLALQLVDQLHVDELELHINNIGCKGCRPSYNKALKTYFSEHIDEMCEDCRNRLDKNPLRILDCKKEHCRSIIEKAPMLSEYVCEECTNHFAALKSYLDTGGVTYIEDPKLVRGLDYYTRSVFEVITNNSGAQGTVCGGGRYDNLIEEIGGPSMPGVGFGMGMERLLLVLEAQNVLPESQPVFSLYIANYGDEAKNKAWVIASELRRRGVAVEMDLLGRSMKAQFKYANKINVAYVLTIGEEEITTGVAKLRNMKDGEEQVVALSNFVDTYKTLISAR